MPVAEIPEFHTQQPSEEQLSAWESQIIDKGYIIIPNALPLATVEHFRKRLLSIPDSTGYGSNSQVRLFEHGMDFVGLLENEPVFSLAERLFGPRLHINNFAPLGRLGSPSVYCRTTDRFDAPRISYEQWLKSSPEQEG